MAQQPQCDQAASAAEPGPPSCWDWPLRTGTRDPSGEPGHCVPLGVPHTLVPSHCWRTKHLELCRLALPMPSSKPGHLPCPAKPGVLDQLLPARQCPQGGRRILEGTKGREGTDGSGCTQPAASQMGPDSHCTPPSSLHSPGDPGPRSPSSSRLWMLSRAASASGFCHLVAELALYTWPTPLYAELAILPGSLCPSRW